MEQELSDPRSRVAGQKQVLQSIDDGRAKKVFVADDADGQIKRLIEKSAADSGIECVRVESMDRLGSAAGIRVGAACAAIVAAEDKK